MKPFPCPLEKIYMNEGWLLADTVSRGALMHIIMPWWLSGCPELPLDQDMRMQEMAGLTQARWQRNRENIISRLKKLEEPLRKALENAQYKKVKSLAAKSKGTEAIAKINAERRRLKIAGIKQSQSTSLKDIALRVVTESNIPKTLNESKSTRVDVCLPIKIAGHGKHTPNSFRNAPQKPAGRLIDR